MCASDVQHGPLLHPLTPSARPCRPQPPHTLFWLPRIRLSCLQVCLCATAGISTHPWLPPHPRVPTCAGTSVGDGHVKVRTTRIMGRMATCRASPPPGTRKNVRDELLAPKFVLRLAAILAVQKVPSLLVRLERVVWLDEARFLG